MTDTHRPLDPAADPLAASPFALAEIAQSLRDDPAYESAGKNARCLVRSSALTMVLTVLRQGAELKEHHAPGSATAIVLEGEIAFVVAGAGSGEDAGKEHVLAARHCVVFSEALAHSVRARQDSVLLIAIGSKATPEPTS